MISGFMILKNVLKTGYPFVEAIASALPVCDEFLISEGYSTDGTYEIVERISKLNRKVKVFRQEWPAVRRFSVLGELTNEVRAKATHKYLLSIQANEIIHEASSDYIKALPEMCPEVDTFSLPFLQLLWNYKFSEEYRLRFSKNLPGIIAVGDAYTLGLSKSFVVRESFKSLRNPRRLIRYIGKGIGWTYANNCTNTLSRAIYLPRPIFRYWALFPQNYIEKWIKHNQMFNVKMHTENIDNLRQQVDNPAEFWKLASKVARTQPLGFNYPESLGTINTSDHPKIMQGLISESQAKSYFVREQIIDLIKSL